MAVGEIGAFSLSEPDAGSDVGALSATARRDGDDYILNGSKNWVTNGAHAGVINTFAKTDTSAGTKGISVFVVDAKTEGQRSANTRTRWDCAPRIPSPCR